MLSLCTVMYPAYAKWIKSHRDLPLKLNQWNNVVVCRGTCNITSFFQMISFERAVTHFIINCCCFFVFVEMGV